MIFVEGDDIQVFFLLMDDAGAALPASSLNDYHVYVYRICEKQKTLIAAYKKNNTGEFSISVDGSIANKIGIIISRDITQYINPSDMLAEVRIQIPAAGFKDNMANVTATGLSLAQLLQSANPTGLQ
jgi:hypothetical protein